MISIQSISKSFGDRVLLQNASLQINHGDRFAIVGPNGCGKSTFFKMLTGLAEPDSGTISFKRGLTTGYLAQEITVSDTSVLATALSKIDDPSPKTEADAKQILAGLGFKNSDFARPVSEMSGGWAMRAELASLLLMRPDILLLDEPTNHLDLSSVEWLKDWLVGFSGTIIVISHDRDFINTVCEAVVSLEHQGIRVYNGNYEFYIDQAEQERQRLIARYNDQQDEIKKLKDFIDRNRVRATTASRAQSAIKRLEKIELIELPTDGPSVHINFPRPEHGGQRVVTLKNVTKRYGDLIVYEGLNYTLEKNQKIALAGKNGAGKSTLLKLLAGVIEPDEGERILGHNIRCGYYSQRRSEMLNPKRTVLAEALDSGRSHPELFVRTVLGAFLFRGDDVFKKTEVLSGGEKSRLALAKILLNPPNLLLLDEPTTHLDIASVDALVRALRDYDGTLCFISHDVYFINAIANEILHAEHGVLTVYPGNYDYFRQRMAQKAEEAALAARPAAPKPQPKPAAAPEPEKKKIGLRELEKMMKGLEHLVKEKEKTEDELAKPEVYTDHVKAGELTGKLQELNGKIAEAETAILQAQE